MTVVIVILCVLAWYAIGLLGSAIHIGSIHKELDLKFPSLPLTFTNSTDRAVGYSLASGGVINLILAITFYRKKIELCWPWQEYSKRQLGILVLNRMRGKD